MKKILILLAVLIFAAGCGGEDAAVSQFARTEGATLSNRNNQIIRSFLDDMLFDNFPVSSIGTGAFGRIYVSIRRVDEEAYEVIEEMLEFIASAILANSQLSAIDIDLGVFNFETAGPIQRFYMQDYENLPITFPDMPRVRTSITFEDAYEFFRAQWQRWEWGQVEFTGEHTIRMELTLGQQGQSQFVSEQTFYAFRINDIQIGVMRDCATRLYFSNEDGSWRVDPHHTFILYPDETKTTPTLHVTDITPEGLTFFFANQTKNDFIYGAPFRLYVLEGDMWRLLNPAMSFIGIGFLINPLSTTEPRTMDWTGIFEGNPLPAGEYRFTKDFYMDGYRDGFTASQRFVIE